MAEKGLWLSRDNHPEINNFYNIHVGEPTTNYSGKYYHLSGGDITICPKLFRQFIEGARLRKGQKKRITRILIELED